MQAGDAPFLAGQLLIAMPGIGDPRFDRSVIFLCAHSQEGAMGLVINKPAPDLQFSELLSQLKIPKLRGVADARVHLGGPVEHGRGFVLHSGEYEIEGATLKISDRFSMTATVDVLQDMARGVGPALSLLALGYSGWGPGQLETEIQRNGWLTAPAEAEVVFGSSNSAKWEMALRSLSIDPRLLSAEGGRA